jgi:transposase-like protein
MNELPQCSKNNNQNTSEHQPQSTEVIASKKSSVNPLASICKYISEKQVRVCPMCGKSHFILNGKKKGIQYFLCKSCGRSFNEFSGTTISYIKKKEKLQTYFLLMLSGSGIKDCSDTLGISNQTSFDWRHKIIASLREYVPDEYKGITEMIDLSEPFSRKGQGAKAKQIGKKGKITDPACNRKTESIQKGENKPLSLVAIGDRNSHFEITIVQQGTLQEEELKKYIGKKLNKVKKLCLSDRPILQHFAGNRKISYFIRKKDQKVRGCNLYYHTGTIERRYLKLFTFMDRFHGVSSSYLQNYLYWYMIFEQIKFGLDSSSAMIEKSISINNGKEDYKHCKMFV